MDRKIRVGAVSYLNTKPLIYGFEQGMMKSEVDLVINYPSKVAEDLLADRTDIGLVPVAIIPQLKEHHIISDYCIGAESDVTSVCLFSEVPLAEVKTILLDYQSMTSVELLTILVKEYWKLNVDLVPAGEDYISKIKGATAGLIIGDRALEQRTNYKYIYDLAGEWRQFTGLPFVFAAWVSNKDIPEDFIRSFNKANKHGLDNLAAVVNENPFAAYDLATYYTQNISYHLDEGKRKGMKLFLGKLKGKG